MIETHETGIQEIVEVVDTLHEMKDVIVDTVQRLVSYPISWFESVCYIRLEGSTVESS